MGAPEPSIAFLLEGSVNRECSFDIEGGGWVEISQNQTPNPLAVNFR